MMCTATFKDQYNNIMVNDQRALEEIHGFYPQSYPIPFNSDSYKNSTYIYGHQPQPIAIYSNPIPMGPFMQPPMQALPVQHQNNFNIRPKYGHELPILPPQEDQVYQRGFMMNKIVSQQQPQQLHHQVNQIYSHDPSTPQNQQNLSPMERNPIPNLQASSYYQNSPMHTESPQTSYSSYSLPYSDSSSNSVTPTTSGFNHLQISSEQVNNLQHNAPYLPSDQTNDNDIFKKKVLPGPIKATNPVLQFDDTNGDELLSFRYTDFKVPKEFTLRIPRNTINISEISDEFKKKNCLYPKAMVPVDQYQGRRYKYETECNEIGWVISWYNEDVIKGRKGVLQRAVDSWRNTRKDLRLRSRRVRGVNGRIEL